LSVSEFEEMTVYEVFVKLFARRDRQLNEEVRDRRNIFFLWKAQGVKINNMPLNYMWQVWNIPEIDRELEKQIKYTTVRFTEEWEEKLLKEKPKGWEQLLLQGPKK
jgi:hypothetical protein